MTYFKFGENWKNFSSLIDKERLIEAEKSLIKLADKKKLTNLSFLDIGCGSGLSSLAALKLNCKKIYSIDQDKDSFQTTKKIYNYYFELNKSPNSKYFYKKSSQ